MGRVTETKEDEARRLSDHSRKDLPRIKVVSPYSASWTHKQQEAGDGSH
jgi:hypothetical protein